MGSMTHDSAVTGRLVPTSYSLNKHHMSLQNCMWMPAQDPSALCFDEKGIKQLEVNSVLNAALNCVKTLDANLSELCQS